MIKSAPGLMKRQYRGFPLWLPALLSRTALYFFLMSLTLFMLYVVGNFQHFSDGNLRLLVSIMDVFFYSYLILSIGNILVQLFFHEAEKGERLLLSYLRTGLSMFLIIILYFAIKLLSVLFNA